MKHPYSNIVVQRVEYIPKEIVTGTMYVSDKYKTAVHLCPCGCGNKAVTPLDGDHSWELTGPDYYPTLRPSCLNTYECRSHY